VPFYTENGRFAFFRPHWGLRGNVRTMIILGSLESM